MAKQNIFQSLNKVIVFQTPDVITDNFGGHALFWKDAFQTWASIKQVNNVNPQVRSHNFSHNFYEIITRKNKIIKSNMRIKFENKILEIETINDHPSNADGYFQIITYEQVKNDIRFKH
jgi:SPP1 family predicted phage head-tail adaptor